MIVFVVVFLVAVLVLVASIVIDTPSDSQFELERRKKTGSKDAEALLSRREHLADLISLVRTLASLLLVVVVAACVAAWGWVFGLAIALVVALQYGALARIPFVHNFAQKYYEKYEPAIIRFITRYPFIAKIVRTITTTPADSKLGSREELLHLVSQSGVVLSHDEKSMIAHTLQFATHTVRDIMTPRSVIDSIGRYELLNPLVLDQLHKTGHSRFPVIDSDIDHVVGMLYLRDVLTIDSSKKHTARVETAMEPKVFYIHENQTLDHALAAFLRTHHHLFVVVNEYRETVGLVSLEDVMEKLLGKKIIDEFDAHDDLRLVAERNPRRNNHAAGGKDV
jgi:CBS domain containing-hemolysin-like protein